MLINILSAVAMFIVFVVSCIKYKSGYSVKTLACICALLGFSSYVIVSEMLTRKEIARITNVATADTATPGLYQVIATYVDSGHYYHIIQRQSVLSLNTERREVLSTPIDPFPSLFRTESDILRSGTTNSIGTGLIEIGAEDGIAYVREFRPFKHFKK